MRPLVSIIIPVFNAQEFLAEAIESALKQTYKNKEIIIIDDGSTDNSLEVSKRFIGRGVAVIAQANNGASSARNHGIRLAKGEFIQFLDADDILDSYKIEYQVQTIQHFSPLCLIGAIWRRFDQDILKPYLPRPYSEQETKQFDNIEWLINRPYMVPHTWLVSKVLIEKAGLWNERLSFNDDGEFFYRIIAASERVVIDHRAVCFYRTGNSLSLSNRRDRSAMISWIESIRSYKKIMLSLAGTKAIETIDRYFFELSYNCVNKFPDLYEVCRSEMSDPLQSYNLSDRLVFHLSKYVGIGRAKAVRGLLNSFRKNRVSDYIIHQTKRLVGWQSF